MNEFIDRHRFAVLVFSALVPVGTSVVIVPFRASLESTNAGLVLVLVVVGAASTGIRPAGILAALSSAVSFDFFLTAPFNTLAITDRADIETAVLLILVGLAVTEVALWGRRQQGAASRQQGYLAGVLQTVGSVARGDSEPSEVTKRVAEQLQEVLGLDAVRFDSAGGSTGHARLQTDGSVTWAGHRVDVDRSGIPTDTEIELLVQNGGTVRGRYLLTASTSIRRPSLEQRQVAIALADQVGAALAVRGDRA
jgi:K+-sensing histidine kinase KdpD